MTSDPRRELDAIVDGLLRREPPPQVVAIDEAGLFVSMPATVPVRDGCLIEGRTSALQLVIFSDMSVVVETYHRALREGVASCPVRLLGDSGAAAELWFADARHRYGVLLGFIVVPAVPRGGEAAGPGVWHSKKDQYAVITDVDAGVSEILGWRTEELIGRRSSEFIHPEDVPRATTNWMEMLSAPGAGHRARLRFQHSDGSWIWFEITNHNRLNDPAYCCVLSDMVDISDEIGSIDPLTGCLNRPSILAALGRRIQAPFSPASGTAVMLVHLDRLKRINDLSGHAVGDEFLRRTSQRLLLNARPGDVVGRLGGDQFLMVCEDVVSEEQAAATAERVGAALREIIETSTFRIEPTVSIGVAWTDGGMNAEGLVAAADAAIQTKAGGRHSNEVFRSSLRNRTTRKLQLQTALRHAIERDELSVFYQPIIDLGTHRVSGFEALLRWQHPQFGPISPLEAIPIAEESGLIVEIGKWVMRKACAQTRDWRTRLPICDELTINVNVSPVQFREIAFIENVDRALLDSGLPPSFLHIEITETLLVDDLSSTKAILVQLRERGIEVHIDDFGTGYSSLAYLDQLPVDVLKIDKAFVSGASDELANAQIVETIINLARQLGVKVTAEGIETFEQERLLRALCCANGQGFLFSRPLSADQVDAYLTLTDVEHRYDEALTYSPLKYGGGKGRS